MKLSKFSPLKTWFSRNDQFINAVHRSWVSEKEGVQSGGEGADTGRKAQGFTSQGVTWPNGYLLLAGRKYEQVSYFTRRRLN